MLPPVPRWVIGASAAAWLVLMVIAAFVGRFDGIWYDVASNVLASAAGVAFATTGAATCVSRWQHRQHLTDTAVSTASVLNTAADDVHALLKNLFEILDGIVPVLEAAPPRFLSALAGPPYDPTTAELAASVAESIARNSIVRPSSLDRQQLVHRLRRGWATLNSERFKPEDLLSLHAKTVVRVMSALEDSDAVVSLLSQNLERDWPVVSHLVSRLSTSLATLRPSPLGQLRPVELQMTKPQAVHAGAGPGGPRLTELAGDAAAQASHTDHETDKAATCVADLAGEAVRLSCVLTDLRSEFCGLDAPREEMWQAQQRVLRHDYPITSTRPMAVEYVARALNAAWERLDQSIPIPTEDTPRNA